MAKGIKTIAAVCEYILHPSKILIALWSCIVSISYPLCLLVCLGALLLYIFGFKKFAKWIPISLGLYVIIQAIGSAVK